ncbi:Branched-chain amino acid transport system substrate-binding protein OS=Castellaniella defragrans OX=75697 GN=HNR28_001293 PE=3 SV=1 [Castellaniella defragrans]
MSAQLDVEYFKVAISVQPSRATENANRLIKRDQVDVLVGTVHSGVALALAKAAKESDTTLIIPNAGADAITGPRLKEVFRTSFSNWRARLRHGQGGPRQGVQDRHRHRLEPAAGKEATDGFKEGFEKAGGKVTKRLTLPFPKVEFQSLLTEIAAEKPDAVFTFFAGGGAVKFVKDYAAAGLTKQFRCWAAAS